MSARRHRHIQAPKPAPKSRALKAARGAKQAAPSLPALPPKPDEMTWPDYLVMLLHIAAELEHALMVEYLYAAYSLGGPGAEQRPREVREWRDAILTVAREEMGHLITVQNLLLLVGGPVSFEREDFPWSSPFYPFPFRLEPLTLDSLACFVYAEMPKDLERPADIKVREEVLKLVKPGDAPTVGEVYDRIIELVADERLIPDSVFNPDSYQYQATWDEWGRSYRPGTHKPYAKDPDVPPPHERKTRVIVARMATRTEAVAGLRDIAGQGEAEHLRPGDKMEDSHFDRFARIFRAYQAIHEKEPAWSPSRPVPTNPYAGEAAYAPAGMTAIANRSSMLWASLFNIRYRMLLSLLTYMFHFPTEAPAPGHRKRAAILARIFGEMYNLKAVAGILVRLPLDRPADPRRAGPPFQLPYSLVPPMPEANFWRLQLELLEASADLTRTLLDPKARHLAHAPKDGGRYLHALQGLDADARQWTEQLLEGLTLSRRARA